MYQEEWKLAGIYRNGELDFCSCFFVCAVEPLVQHHLKNDAKVVMKGGWTVVRVSLGRNYEGKLGFH